MKETSVNQPSRWKITSTIFLVAFFCAPILYGQQDVEQEKIKFVRENQTTSDFSNVKETVLGYLGKYTANEILLVVDIDNTLLAMNQDLGSDQWFNWQEDLLKNDPESPDLVAKAFPDLIEAQGLLFAISGMHPPEPELPAMIKEIQNKGVKTLVLTSRGPSFRDATERELRKNEYDFSSNSFSIREKRGAFFPFDPEHPGAHGLTDTVATKLKPRLDRVSYSSGIFLTAGQHKGYMLHTLLARRVVEKGEPENFKAIIFVDDHLKHTVRMHEAFNGAELDLSTFRYSREDGNVSNFHKSSKKRVAHDWNRLRESIDLILVQHAEMKIEN